MDGAQGMDADPYGGPLAAPPSGSGNRVVVVLGVAILLVTGAAIAGALTRPVGQRVPSAFPGTGCGPVRDLGPEEEVVHATGEVEYTTSPPHSGRHNPMPLRGGGRRVVPRAAEHAAERAVHNLEHAYVVVWYGPAASDDHVARVGDAVRETGLRKVLVVPWDEPFEDGPAPFVMASWGYLQVCDGVPDAAAITAFWNGYAGPNGRAPEKDAP